MMLVGVITLALLVAVPTALIFTWYRCHVRLRAKGYGRFVITLSFLLALFASFSVFSRTGNDVLMTLGAPAAWVLFVIGLARVVPAHTGGAQRRLPRRRAGRRRAFVPAMFAWLATAVGGAMTLFFLWQMVLPTVVPRDEGWKALMASVAMTLAVSQYWFNVARRIKTAPATLQPSEASVLYLRAFEEEQRPFAIGPRSALKQHTSQFSASAPYTRGDPTLKLTLEDYLEESITAQIGPFVGLGNPHDRLHPDGAVREYASDDIWQKRFLDLAQSATCIVVSVGGSVNLQWELEQIKQHRLTQKLCLFTSPRVPGSDRGIINTLRRSQAKRDEDLAATWITSIGALRRAGYDCDEVCPGAGAAVTFDETGKSMVLTVDATSPSEFITPVADWFEGGRRTGRCVPVACRSCSAITHATPANASDTALCYACQRTVARTRMSLTERHPVILSVWGIVAMVIAAIILRMFGVASTWAVVLMWFVVLFSPVVIQAGWRSMRQRLMRRQQIEEDAGAAN
jgi:hypothetical protein